MTTWHQVSPGQYKPPVSTCCGWLRPVEESAQIGDSEPKQAADSRPAQSAARDTSYGNAELNTSILYRNEKPSVGLYEINTTNQVCSLNVTEDFRLSSSLIHSPMQLSPGTTPQKFGPDACKSLGQLRRQLLHLQRMGVDLWICRWKMVMVEAHWSPSTEWFANSLMMVFCESWSSGSLWSYWNWPVDAILGISRLGTKPDQPKSSCFSPRNRIQLPASSTLTW